MHFLRPSPQLLTARLTQLVLGVAGGIVVAVVIGLLGATAPWVAGVVVVTLVLAAAGVLVSVGRYRAWGYLERHDDFVVQRGVLVRRTSVVPYGRMQFIDVSAGPIDRFYGIATVQLHTAAAATDARVPGLPAAEAMRLRDRLTALGEARSTGL